MRRKPFLALGVVWLLVTLLFGLSWPESVDPAALPNDWLSDLHVRLAAPKEPRAKVLAVAITEDEAARWPEPMSLWGTHLAEVVRRLQDAGAGSVALDFAIEADADRALVDFVSKVAEGNSAARTRAEDSAPNLALLTALAESKGKVVLGEAGLERLAPGLADRQGWTTGSIEISPSLDGVLRDLPQPVETHPGRVSLAEAAAGRAVSGNRRVMFARSTPTLSLTEALSKEHQEEVRGAVVFVGLGFSDWVSTPIESGDDGVRIQANMAGAILDGRLLDKVFAPWWRLISTALAAGAPLLVWRSKLVLRFLALALCIFLILIGAVLGGSAFHQYLPAGAAIFGVAAMTLAASLADLILTRLESADRLVERARMEGALTSLVSKPLLSHLLSKPDRLDRRGGPATISCLFLDIRGSVALGQSMEPAVYVELLNAFFQSAAEPVERHGGFISRFLGDGFFAVFGFPEAQPGVHPATSAANAAKEIQEAIARFNRTSNSGVPWEAGIGIEHGDCIFGGIGSPERWEFTVIGRTVNVAARLESMNKELGTSLLISEACWNAIGEPSTFRAYPGQRIKGLEGEQVVYGIPKNQTLSED